LITKGHPPLIIYDEDKYSYYDALERYDMQEKIMPMQTFLETQLEKTWEKSLERQRSRGSGGA